MDALAAIDRLPEPKEYRLAPIIRKALFPTDLPSVPGARVAARAVTSDERLRVGGDFLDVFPIEGAWGLACGDVAGKGAPAAADSVMVKYMLRALALRNPSPASVMFT